MSAVRMVAYGVLELEIDVAPAWFEEDTDEKSAARQQRVFKNDQLRKLVNDELKRYGLLLARATMTKGTGWKTSKTQHVLYGQVQKSGFKRREVLHEGDYRSCCEVAAKLLDELDKAQIPDVATGSD